MLNSWKQNLPEDLIAKVAKVDEKISGHLQKIDEQVLYNQQRLLSLFIKHRVAEEDLVGSTGYGFDDMGREKLEAIFADYFKVDDALVRPQLIVGDNPKTLKEYDINFDYTPLNEQGKVDYDAVKEKLQNDKSIKMVAIQRSRGYATRDSFVVDEVKEMIEFVKQYAPNRHFTGQI